MSHDLTFLHAVVIILLYDLYIILYVQLHSNFTYYILYITHYVYAYETVNNRVDCNL